MKLVTATVLFSLFSTNALALDIRCIGGGRYESIKFEPLQFDDLNLRRAKLLNEPKLDVSVTIDSSTNPPLMEIVVWDKTESGSLAAIHGAKAPISGSVGYMDSPHSFINCINQDMVNNRGQVAASLIGSSWQYLKDLFQKMTAR